MSPLGAVRKEPRVQPHRLRNTGPRSLMGEQIRLFFSRGSKKTDYLEVSEEVEWASRRHPRAAKAKGTAKWRDLFFASPQP